MCFKVVKSLVFGPIFIARNDYIKLVTLQTCWMHFLFVLVVSDVVPNINSKWFRCILFPLIILEMFLQLDWSPPVVNSIDWTWFGEEHTCLDKVPQLTVHVGAKTKPWGWRNCPWSSETGLCRGTDLGKSTNTFLQYLRSPRTQWPPSFLNGRSLESPRLPRAGCPVELSNQGKRVLLREVTENPLVTLTEL